MFFSELELTNFRNYESTKISFCPEVNALVGNNGSGKTNLLDAVHYLALTKSAFQYSDFNSIKHQEQYFSIRSVLKESTKSQTVFCAYQKGKKVFKIDDLDYEKLSEHIGKILVVIISPYDSNLISGGSEDRRRFLDGLLCQIDSEYMSNLVEYNRHLKHRNGVLKKLADQALKDKDLITIYDAKILTLGQKIHNVRKQFLLTFSHAVKRQYTELVNYDAKEEAKIYYESHLLEEQFSENFRQAIERDMMLQRTTLGIHKDDINFTLGDLPIKKFGSQGQQKSLILALKLSQYSALQEATGRKPILLLDDIFDKLDEPRIEKLMGLVSSNTFGQIFLTDARPERTRKYLKTIRVKNQTIEINHGKILSQ